MEKFTLGYYRREFITAVKSFPIPFTVQFKLENIFFFKIKIYTGNIFIGSQFIE
jgi:hypothetical protein